jgi:hypothetical protein
MNCPYCGGELDERPDVVARALKDSVPGVSGSNWIEVEWVPDDVVAMGCRHCEQTFMCTAYAKEALSHDGR